MAFLKSKQIASLSADKVGDISGDKNFVTSDDLTAIGTIADKIEQSYLDANLVTTSSLGDTLSNYLLKSVLDDYANTSDIQNAQTGLALLTDGKVSLNNMPEAALERVVNVADQTAMYALTTATVQLGDSVKDLETGLMYIVKDTGNLGNANGYEQYLVNTTWAAVYNKPNSSVANIDATVAKLNKIGYLDSVALTVATNGDTVLNTGIMTNGTGDHFTDASYDIEMRLNGFIQAPGVDYTKAVVDNEIVITFLEHGGLELATTDEVIVFFTQLVPTV